MVEKLATQGPDASFGESVLPGRARRDPNLLDSQGVVDARVELRDRTGEIIADPYRQFHRTMRSPAEQVHEESAAAPW